MQGAEIRALARLLDRMDYYRLLRVQPEARPPEIRSAFSRMRREFHPDTFLRQPDEIRDAVGAIAKRLNEAFNVLRDPARRGHYDEGLIRGELRYSTESEEAHRSQAEAHAGQTPNGRKFYALCEEALRHGDLEGGLKNLRMALTFEPANGPFKAKAKELQARIPKKKKGASYTIR